jgi:hypothetical protein
MVGKMNWDKVRADSRIRRFGTEPVAEGLPTTKTPNSKGQRASLEAGMRKAAAKMGSGLVDRALVKWVRERELVAKKKRLVRKDQKAKNLAAAEARSIAKKQKRLEEEQRIRQAQAAKAARKALNEAQAATAREKRRERLKAQSVLDAQRKADPDYQAKQSAAIAKRLAQRMKSVVVVRKSSPRSPRRTNTTSSAKRSSSR